MRASFLFGAPSQHLSHFSDSMKCTVSIFITAIEKDDAFDVTVGLSSDSINKTLWHRSLRKEQDVPTLLRRIADGLEDHPQFI